MRKLQKVGPHEWRFRWPQDFYDEALIMDDAIELAAQGDEGEAERRLRAVLERSPEHIDIMQALAQVLNHTDRKEQAGTLWRKAVDLGRSAFPPRAFKVGRDLLEWDWLENRPFLRCLRGLMYHSHFDLGETNKALDLAYELLALNPRDNQGVRASAMSWLLAAGRDVEAVELAERYPDDFFPETTYGRALALYRLGRTPEADSTLKAAIDNLPAVTAELLRDTHRAPSNAHSGYESIGGTDQAYNYWEVDGQLWEGSGDALDWLRRIQSEVSTVDDFHATVRRGSRRRP